MALELFQTSREFYLYDQTKSTVLFDFVFCADLNLTDFVFFAYCNRETFKT